MTKDYELGLIIGSEEEEEEEEGLTPEEKAEEEQGLAEVKTEELKAELAEKYGIDPEGESELLEKIVENDMTQRGRLSKAIKQKQSWREKAKKTEKPTEPKPPEGGKEPLDADKVAEIASSAVTAALEADRLNRLNLPEVVTTEIKDIAKLRSITIGEAAKLPYILNRIDEVQKEERIKNATPKRGNNSRHQVTVDPSKPLDSKDFDLSSEEGQKQWDEAKEARRKHRNK